MPTSADKSNAKETTRMIVSCADSIDLGAWLRAGIAASKWRDYTDGRVAMSLPVLHSVARVLGLSVGQLISKAEGRHRG